jgi:ABC-type transport system involved in cytochrome bd biosynthesis fused ATPase/permease subunit
MTQTTRKLFAIILLVLLLVVPFINWKLGALFWMCAWLIFIFQNLFSRQTWKLGKENDEDSEPE